MPHPTNCLHDADHIVTPRGLHTAGQLAPHVTRSVDEVDDFITRYSGRNEAFLPIDVEVDLWEVEAGGAMNAVADLRARSPRIDARPVYMFGVEGHWSLEPGREPAFAVDLDDESLPEFSEMPPGDSLWYGGVTRLVSGPGATVGVVDAGFRRSFPEIPGDADEVTRRRAAVSVHGTFVMSLIEAISPESTILFREVPQIASGVRLRFGTFFNNPAYPELAAFARTCTDGLALARAIREIGAAMLETDSEVNYLNLSLGTYSAVVNGEVVDSLEVETALNSLVEAGIRVIAAAGNDKLDPQEWGLVEGRQSEPQFYPACRADVVAVGAANRDLEPQEWSHGVREVSSSPWWTIMAPGIDLVGGPLARMGDTATAVKWSGSSFAAAVVSGGLAADNLSVTVPRPTLDPIGGPWGIPVVRYEDVPGLVWMTDAGIVMNGHLVSG